MELYEYISIFKKYRRKIISIVIVAMLGALGMGAIRSTQHDASFSMIIRPKVLEKTENFQLTDALEASDRVSRMTENWIKEQGWNIKTKRLGAQIITIAFQEKSESAGRGEMEDIKEKSDAFIASLSSSPELGAFELLGSNFSFQKRKPYWAEFLLAGFIIGLLVGFFLALFKHYTENEAYHH